MLQVLLIAGWLLAASPVKQDENVILFPVAAHWNADRQSWTGELHGWIFEPGSSSRTETSAKAMSRLIQHQPDAASWRILQHRLAPFLVDNERGKRLEVKILDRPFVCQPSEASGHFRGNFEIPASSVPAKTTVVQATVLLRAGDRRAFVGAVHLLPSGGISVISDIDDTIKISNVEDKKELLSNTFVRPFAPVAGMANWYQALAARGAAFHYVSGSPWQLYAPLEAFRARGRFPAGTYDLRSFRAWDDTRMQLLDEPEVFKRPAIEKLLRDFPTRQFILVGDSGEADPEIFGDVARQHPQQVVGIAIRATGTAQPGSPRFLHAFRDLPPGRAVLFRDPAELSGCLRLWCPTAEETHSEPELQRIKTR